MEAFYANRNKSRAKSFIPRGMGRYTGKRRLQGDGFSSELFSEG